MKALSVSHTVDFITVTAQGQERATSLVQTAVEYGMGAGGQIPMQESWFFKGYRGWKQEGLAYGTRGSQESIVQAWGFLSDDSYQRIFEHVTNCSRIDFATTVHLAEIDKSVAMRAYNVQTEKTKMKSTLFMSNRGGQTCYLGSRSSRNFGRLYDKGAQEGSIPGVIWRYELEMKKPVSMLEYTKLMAIKDKRRYIGNVVHNFFTSRGVVCPWDSTVPHDAIEIPRNLTNSQKQLQWLEKQVQPAVRRLIDEGLGLEVLTALGFSEIAPPWSAEERRYGI